MKHLRLIITLVVFSSVTSTLLAQQDSFIKDYLERLENSHKYLIRVAEMMPEEKYDFKATPESLSFGENLMHIGYAVDWHSQSLLGGREARVWKTDTVYKVTDKSKTEMISTINKTLARRLN